TSTCSGPTSATSTTRPCWPARSPTEASHRKPSCSQRADRPAAASPLGQVVRGRGVPAVPAAEPVELGDAAQPDPPATGSAALPERFAVFDEGHRAFVGVLAGSKAGDQIVLAGERRRVVEALAGPQYFLGRRQRERGVLCDAPGQPCGRLPFPARRGRSARAS